MIEKYAALLGQYLFRKNNILEQINAFKIPADCHEISQGNIAVNAGGERIQAFSANSKISLMN